MENLFFYILVLFYFILFTIHRFYRRLSATLDFQYLPIQINVEQQLVPILQWKPQNNFIIFVPTFSFIHIPAFHW